MKYTKQELLGLIYYIGISQYSRVCHKFSTLDDVINSRDRNNFDSAFNEVTRAGYNVPHILKIIRMENNETVY